MTKLWKTISAFTLVAALFLGLPGCGGETAQRETTPSTAEEQLDLPFANVVSSRDEGWLVEPAQDTVTLPLEDNRTLEFTKVQDHSAADSSQWTDSALITCYDANEDVIWKIETDTVKGWDERDEWVSPFPYIPCGVENGKFFLINLCGTLSYDTWDQHEYDWDQNKNMMIVIDVKTGDILQKSDMRHNMYYNVIGFKSSPQGEIAMTLGESVLLFDKEGKGVSKTRVGISRQGQIIQELVDSIVTKIDGYYVEGYNPERGEWDCDFYEPAETDSWNKAYDLYLDEGSIQELPWKDTYVEYLKRIREAMPASTLTYQLIYLDDSYVPDLVVYNWLTQNAFMYSGKYRRSAPLIGEVSGLSYIEGTGKVSYSRIINDDCIEFRICEYNWKDWDSMMGTKEKIESGWKYELQYTELSEEEFYDGLTEAFDPAQAKKLDLRQGYTADEMLEIIENM